jgi:hypothetical protein
MTPSIRNLITRLDRHGFTVLAYHDGTFWVAGIGARDLDWCKRATRLEVYR